MWTTPWCKDGDNIHDHIKSNLEGPCRSIISDLWKPNSKCWDEDKISTYFDDNFKNGILDIPVISADYKYMICWTNTHNAVCTKKSAYKTSM